MGLEGLKKRTGPKLEVREPSAKGASDQLCCGEYLGSLEIKPKRFTQASKGENCNQF